jgi:hypothetical protein
LARDFEYVAYDDSNHAAVYETVGSKDNLEFSVHSDHGIPFEAARPSTAASQIGDMEDADFVEIELASSIQASSPETLIRSIRNPMNASLRCNKDDEL